MNLASIKLTALASTLMLAAGSAHGQCPDPHWLPGEGFSSLGGWIGITGGAVTPLWACSTMWDPDGPGPLPARLVIAGDFLYAGNTRVNSIASWDGAAWQPLGEGFYIEHEWGKPYTGSGVYALLSLPNGHLIAAGDMLKTGDTVVNGIAEWDGTQWKTLGTGLAATESFPICFALARLSNGDIVAAGGFDEASGVPVQSIAKWNGSAWSDLGGGFSLDTGFGECRALAIRPNGDLVAAGAFDHAGGVSAQNIARWNGSTWAPYGGGLTAGADFPWATHLGVLANGDVLVGGHFTQAGNVAVSNLARYNGTTWSDFGNGGLNAETNLASMFVTPSGDVVVDGWELTSAGGTPVTGGARWNGNTWTSIGHPGGIKNAAMLTLLPNNELAGIDPTTFAPIHDDNGTWKYFADGLLGGLSKISAAPNGDVYAIGSYAFATTTPVGYKPSIIRWDGSQWHQVPGDFDNGAADLSFTPQGDLIAAGYFKTVDGIPVNRIARWNGTSWSGYGAGLNANATCVLGLPNSDVVVGGFFTKAGATTVRGLARWNGSGWADVGGGVDGYVSDLAAMANGNLAVAGTFAEAGGSAGSCVAIWDGSNWNMLDGGIAYTVGPANALAIATRPNGDLVVVGTFDSAGSSGLIANAIGLWNGSAWESLGNGFPESYAIDVLARSNGDIVAGGIFHTQFGSPADHIGRWDGSTWSSLGAVDGFVYGLTERTNGDLMAIGGFYTVDGQVSMGVATYGCEAGPCYADCDGSGELNIDDFICFQTLFAIGSNAADCDASGSLDIDDFICFQTLFALGC